MGFLAWVCVPLLRDQLGGRDPFIESLLICLNVGLLWILALTLILLRREQADSNGHAWSTVCGFGRRAVQRRGRSAGRSGYGQFRSSYSPFPRSGIRAPG
jgi:hypothetical protein